MVFFMPKDKCIDAEITALTDKMSKAILKSKQNTKRFVSKIKRFLRDDIIINDFIKKTEQKEIVWVLDGDIFRSCDGVLDVELMMEENQIVLSISYNMVESIKLTGPQEKIEKLWNLVQTKK